MLNDDDHDEDPDPLEEVKSKAELAEEERAAKLAKQLRLRDECQYALMHMPEFMEMVSKGVEAARSEKEQAVNDMKPLELIQRHAGAEKFGADLLRDIKKMAEFKLAPKREKKRNPYG